ncbi:hypothetical protein B0H19DRAFT_1160015 [Mycena capillaripes]|nr:hypothetical protein B0H19DRAFT_1160015 [Mycena capillaripes]
MNSPHTPAHTGSQQPGSGEYPASYGQTPFLEDPSMRDYEWPPQQGSSRYPGSDPRFG